MKLKIHALQAQNAGEVAGGGSGSGRLNIDVEIHDLATGLDIVRSVLQELGVARSTVIRCAELNETFTL